MIKLILCLLLVISCRTSTTIISDGKDGIDGTNGVDGKDATGVYMVKFCEDQNDPSYGYFPEFGFCISGKIYATFWDDKNAFTTELSEGWYTTTSTGLKCTFYVGENCTIEGVE
jgi:hypothetical protein